MKNNGLRGLLQRFSKTRILFSPMVYIFIRIAANMSPCRLKSTAWFSHTETSKLMYDWSFLCVVLHKPTLLNNAFKHVTDLHTQIWQTSCMLAQIYDSDLSPTQRRQIWFLHTVKVMNFWLVSTSSPTSKYWNWRHNPQEINQANSGFIVFDVHSLAIMTTSFFLCPRNSEKENNKFVVEDLVLCFKRWHASFSRSCFICLSFWGSATFLFHKSAWSDVSCGVDFFSFQGPESCYRQMLKTC